MSGEQNDQAAIDIARQTIDSLETELETLRELLDRWVVFGDTLDRQIKQTLKAVRERPERPPLAPAELAMPGGYELSEVPPAIPETIKALERVKEQAGWRGDGENPDIFYCEFCKAAHEDCFLILHTEACVMTQVEAALAKARGETL